MKSAFTIIEILVAMLSVTLISLFSYQYLSNTALVKDRIDQVIENDAKILNSLNFLRIDLMQSVNFLMKDINGRPLNIAFAGDGERNQIMFVSMNGNNYHEDYSNLRRIKYFVEDEKFIRTTSLANREDKILSSNVLLEGFDDLSISFSDDLINFSSQWGNDDINSFPKFIFIEFSINNELYTHTMSTFK